MAVIKNLMIRIGADFSSAKKGMQGATSELTKFKKNTTRASADIKGRNGLGGIAAEYKSLGSTISHSLSAMRGAKGISGVASELGSLRMSLRGASGGMRSFGASAGEASAAMGPVGLGIAALTALLAVSSVGLYKASQRAVKFESDIGRLNMQLKGGSRDFMEWARAQKLAKSTSAEMGSTFSVLLSSFIHDNQELAKQTKQVVQTTRIVASATGRTISDTTERIRSGLLGNTEAIEDLGIFVNISMIESTNAFKRFANGKHWDQLDFRVQQQIRLAAILEQAHARYGDKLQNNVMTRQERFLEQLKDIKLNMSQAFAQIWDSVLPALTRLAESIAYVTEKVARFVYWIRGKDYDDLTMGTNEQTDAVQDQGDAYDDLADQAKAARKELASFDQLNLIGDGSDGGGTGGSGGSGSTFPIDNPPSSDPGSVAPGIPIPPLTKLQLTFDPPKPPDAGAGAVATAVTNTTNGMISQTKSAHASMWVDLQRQGKDSAPLVAASHKSALGQMLQDLNATRPYLEYGWKLIALGVRGPIPALGDIKAEWKGALSDMLQKVNANRPYLQYGWKLIALSVRGVTSPLADIKALWSETFTSMETVTAQKVDSIVNKIKSLKGALDGAKGSSPDMSPASSPGVSAVPDYSGIGAPAASPGRVQWGTMPAWVENSPLGAFLNKAHSVVDSFSSVSNLLGQLYVPGGGGAVSGARGLSSGATKIADDAIARLKDLFRGAGIEIPAFANGALVYGPTMAMVGDNRGAATDPEVIAPLSKLESMIGGGDDKETVAVLRAILQAVKENKTIQAVISRDAVGRASAEYYREQARRGRNPLPI